MSNNPVTDLFDVMCKQRIPDADGLGQVRALPARLPDPCALFRELR